MSYIAREDAVQLLKKYNKDIWRSIALSSDVLASAVCLPICIRKVQCSQLYAVC